MTFFLSGMVAPDLDLLGTGDKIAFGNNVGILNVVAYNIKHCIRKGEQIRLTTPI